MPTSHRANPGRGPGCGAARVVPEGSRGFAFNNDISSGQFGSPVNVCSKLSNNADEAVFRKHMNKGGTLRLVDTNVKIREYLNTRSPQVLPQAMENVKRWMLENRHLYRRLPRWVEE